MASTPDDGRGKTAETECTGTMECPICGVDRPHGHAPAEIAKHRIDTGQTPQTLEDEVRRLVGLVGMNLDWRRALAGEILQLVRRHIVLPASGRGYDDGVKASSERLRAMTEARDLYKKHADDCLAELCRLREAARKLELCFPESDDDAWPEVIALRAALSPPADAHAGTCSKCGGSVYHRTGKPGEFSHTCDPLGLRADAHAGTKEDET